MFGTQHQQELQALNQKLDNMDKECFIPQSRLGSHPFIRYEWLTRKQLVPFNLGERRIQITITNFPSHMEGENINSLVTQEISLTQMM